MKQVIKLSKDARNFAKGYQRAINHIDAGCMDKAENLTKSHWWRNPMVSLGAMAAVEKHLFILNNK